MSAEKLVLKREWEHDGVKRINSFYISKPLTSELLHVKKCSFALDRSQAHLLMLYLQEKLK